MEEKVLKNAYQVNRKYRGLKQSAGNGAPVGAGEQKLICCQSWTGKRLTASSLLRSGLTGSFRSS